MKSRNGICSECQRPYGKHYAGCSKGEAWCEACQQYHPTCYVGSNLCLNKDTGIIDNPEHPYRREVKVLSDLLGPGWTDLSEEELAAHLRETDWYKHRGEPRKTAECPTCGAYMMNPAKHRDFHQWLERQLEMSQAMGPV